MGVASQLIQVSCYSHIHSFIRWWYSCINLELLRVHIMCYQYGPKTW